MSFRKSSSSKNGSKSDVFPKPKARRKCTPAPSRVGLDFASRFTGRMDMWPPAKGKGERVKAKGERAGVKAKGKWIRRKRKALPSVFLYPFPFTPFPLPAVTRASALEVQLALPPATAGSGRCHQKLMMS